MSLHPPRFFSRVALAVFAWWATVAASAAPSPVISFGFRDTSGEVLEVGEPLAVVVELRAPDDATAAMEIAPATGTWLQAITVELAPAPGGAGAVQAVPLGEPDSPRATLDATRVAGGGWLFSSASTAAITPGNYVVRARLRVNDGAGWRGEAVSVPRAVRVVARSTAPRRTIALANEALLGGRLEQAATLLDGLLKSSPVERDALVLRGVVAERAGNLPAALWYANRATRGLSAKGPPPLELHALRTRLQAQLTGPAAVVTAPPAWSWPPPDMLAGLVAEVKKSPAVAPRPASTVSVSATPAKTATAPAQPAAAPANLPSAPAVVAAPAKAGAPSAGVRVPAAELTEAKILADPNGQWASAGAAGSQYGNAQYSPAQATGAPNVPKAGDAPQAWCHAGSSKSLDWLELTFPRAVSATEVRVRQNNAPGTIVKVEAIEADGTTHVWWEGKDQAGLNLSAGTIAWFAVRVPQSGYAVAKIKLTLDLSLRLGWKQIDAVQLVGAGP